MAVLAGCALTGNHDLTAFCRNESSQAAKLTQINSLTAAL